MKKIFYNLIFLSTALLSACGGGGSNGGSGGIFPNPSLDPSADLAADAVNTFLDNGVNITVNPTYYEFEETSQNEPLYTYVTVTNGTNDSKLITLSLFGSSGGFRMMNEEGEFYSY